MRTVLSVTALLLTLLSRSLAAPCTGEAPDICGYLPSTYANLSLSGVPALCNAQCPEDFQASPLSPGGWDRCGVCGGLATYSQILLEPIDAPENSFIGGSVAAWNGTVAASQHLAQGANNGLYTALVQAPITTWNRNYVTGAYTAYEIPRRIGDASGDLTRVPLGRGYALIMSASHLVIGSHDSAPRELQLWTKTPNADVPWQFAWRSPEFCPGAHYGYSVAIDEDVPKNPGQGIFGTIATGDPSAYKSGAVSIHVTDSKDIVQIIYYGGAPNGTEIVCFGQSVSADGGYLAIGAPAFDYSTYVNAGSVYIYQWNPSAGFTGEYEFLTQIVPPTPLTNGGFGESVSMWNDELLVGDNQRTIYKYKISGIVAVPIGINQPTGLSPVSKLGYTVSLWKDYGAAGDLEHVPSPTQKGTTFVWTRNPLDPNSHLGPTYELYDTTISHFNTYYGSYVDLRGGNGCFVASGAIGEDVAGGVWVANLCRDDCYGCDGVLNSCTVFDECEVCAGNNSTCLDCNGVLNGPSTLDDCGVCEGDNSTCVNPSASPPFILTPCETPFNVTLTYPFADQYGPAEWSVVSGPSKGTVEFFPDPNDDSITVLRYTSFPYENGADSFTLFVEVPSNGANDTLTILVTIGACLDCNGILNGPARPDECGICLGDNSTCAGCDGVPNSGLILDYCGVCGGDNSTCVNILLEPFYSVPCYSHIFFQLFHEPANTPVDWEIVSPPVQGTAEINEQYGYVVYMNPVVMGYDYFTVMITSLLNPNVTDIQNVTLLIQDCMDCDNSTLGIQILDACGICDGDSSTCAGCDGVPNSNNTLDLCDVCAGNNACVDCFGLPNGNATFALDVPGGNLTCCSLPIDICNVCGGDSTSCTTGKEKTPTFFLVLIAVLAVAVILSGCCHNTWHNAHWDYFYRVKHREEYDPKELNDALNDAHRAYLPSYGDQQAREERALAGTRAAWKQLNDYDKNWGYENQVQEAEQSAQANQRFLQRFKSSPNDGPAEQNDVSLFS